jgi:hypothetical protein
MEPPYRMELIDTLLVEATHHLELLAHALTAQAVARQEGPPAGRQETAAPQEQYTLQAEHDWWEKAHQGLTVVKNAFAQIAQSEQQRGASAKGAGA